MTKDTIIKLIEGLTEKKLKVKKPILIAFLNSIANYCDVSVDNIDIIIQSKQTINNVQTNPKIKEIFEGIKGFLKTATTRELAVKVLRDIEYSCAVKISKLKNLAAPKKRTLLETEPPKTEPKEKEVTEEQINLVLPSATIDRSGLDSVIEKLKKAFAYTTPPMNPAHISVLHMDIQGMLVRLRALRDELQLKEIIKPQGQTEEKAEEM